MLASKFVVRTIVAAVCAASLAGVASAQAVRPEVGRPLQQAAEALKAKRYPEATAKAKEADAAGGKTPAEQALIDRMRMSIASQSGDVSTMTGLISSNRLAPAQQLPLIQTVANAYYAQRDYANAVTWYQRYFKEGGTDPQVRTVLTQAYYLNGDCNNVSRSVQGDSADASRVASEDSLQMLRSCYLKGKDNAGYVATLEKLVANYPKRDYWVDLLSRVDSKPGFSDRLTLDVYRLKMATGLMAGPSDYMEMAQMALGDEYTAEAKKIVDQGFSTKVLGGAGDVERQKRLADLATKRFDEGRAALPKEETDALAARDGNDLVTLGYNLVGYGQAPKGIVLMEQGIKKGGLRRPEDAKLHLGIAYLQSGQKAKGLQVLKTVGGTDGTADLARLWTLQANKSA